MGNRPSLDEYVDVAERIQDFMDAHADGSLQTISWEVVDVAGATFIVYRAAAYRTPDDPRPGHGIAWEPFPGTTPYTKNSELMNAETAAWGRAIVALGLVANRKLASRQEVRARQEEADAAEATPDKTKPKPKASAPAPAANDDAGGTVIDGTMVDQIRTSFLASGWTHDQLKWKLVELGVADVEDLTAAMGSLTLDQALMLDEALKSKAAPRS